MEFSFQNSTFHKIQSIAVFGTIVTVTECDELQEINIINSNFASLLKRWTLVHFLKHFTTTLSVLDIRNMPVTIPSLIYALQKIFFKELTMRNCSLYYLPENFIDLTPKLIRLDLSHNQLRFLSL